jgi:hypothetical protein
MADNEEDLVDYDEEEVRRDAHRIAVWSFVW